MFGHCHATPPLLALLSARSTARSRRSVVVSSSVLKLPLLAPALLAGPLPTPVPAGPMDASQGPTLRCRKALRPVRRVPNCCCVGYPARRENREAQSSVDLHPAGGEEEVGENRGPAQVSVTSRTQQPVLVYEIQCTERACAAIEGTRHA